MKNYDPEYESMGLDEANLDMTNYIQENNIDDFTKIEELCKNIRLEINEKTKITCSCGIAPNKMLAKMCSEINKPNGQFLLKNDIEQIFEFMNKRPIRKIPGIGSVNEQLLFGLGVHSCEDILNKKREIKICFTENSFEFFIKAALGISRCYHEKLEERKSFSVSRTFSTISSMKDMEAKLKDLSESIADDLEYAGKIAKHISLNAKTHKFEVKSKNLMLDKYIKSKDEIFAFSCILLKQLWPLDPVRLLGIKLSDLIDEQSFKENGIEKYFSKKKLMKFKQIEEGIAMNENNDESVFDEIDRILEIEQNSIFDHKKNVNFANNPSNDFNFNKQEEIIEKNENLGVKNDSLEKLAKSKKNLIPQIFRCCICDLDIDCGGNSIRMNNHIDKCLGNVGKLEEEKTQNKIENSYFKRKPSEKSVDLNESTKKTPKSKKNINNIKNNKSKNTLENFFKKIK